MIEINNINIKYGSKIVLKDSCIKISRGVITGITGPSGSGKTTLFYIIGLLSSQKGYQYIFDDKNIDIEDDKTKSMIRKKKIGYVFQDKNLHEFLTIEDNMKLYCFISGQIYDQSKVENILHKVQLDEHLKTETAVLSGGQKQRLAIACALIKDPDIIIADEPTSALDSENEGIIMDIFKTLSSEDKMIIIASHSNDILKQCDVVYRIENKELVCNDSIKDNGFTYMDPTIEKNSFTKWYSNFQFGIGSKERKIRFIIPIVTILLCVLGISAKSGLVTYYEKEFNIGSSNDVSVTQFGNEINHDDIVALSNLSGLVNIDSVYEIYTTSASIDGEEILNGNVLEIYSYPSSQQQSFESKNSGSVYITLELSRRLNVNIGDEIVLNNDSLQQNTYIVDAIFDTGYRPVQSSKELSMFIHEDQFINYDATSLLLQFSSFNDLLSVHETVKDINQDYIPVIANSNYIEQATLLKITDEYLSNFIISLVTITVVLLTIMNFIAITNQKYEITILKANGLSNKDILKLLLYMSFNSSWITLISVMGLFTFTYVALLMLHIPILQIDFLTVIALVILTPSLFILPNLLTAAYINHFDVEKLLRF